MRTALWIVGFVVLAVAAVLLIPLVLPQEQRAPLDGPDLSDLRFEEVQFSNGDLALAGLLFLPDGPGPHPAAVLIHGSGTSRRDNPWYLTFAQHLQDNGIAVLLPDKRGSEASEGDWRDTRFEVLATDTIAAHGFVVGLPDIDPERVGLIGFSQGGWIAPVAASDLPDLAFLVSVAGAGVTTEEQLRFEEVNNIIEVGTFPFVARLIARFTVPSIMERETWRATAGFDPIPYWERLDIPAFAALGGGDTNVPVEASIARFETVSPAIEVVTYPDGGHGITDPATGRVQDALLDDLLEFIRSAMDAS